MTSIRLSIEPELCGPVSVGTARVIKLVSEHLEVSLSEAMASVDRCVFDGKEVELGAPSAEAAARLVAALAGLPAHPRVRAVAYASGGSSPSLRGETTAPSDA